MGYKVVERDRVIVREVIRWRYLLGRQIRVLTGFSGQRATDRRLKKMIEEQFLVRKHILYGLPSLYLITKKGIDYFNLDLSESKVRLDQIYHDIAVIDTAIYLTKTFSINLDMIKTEKELRHEMGFNPRVHVPDFIYIKDGKQYCIEVELSVKAKDRLDKNIKDNYLKYDEQIWIIPNDKTKIKENVKEAMKKYSNIKIIEMEVINDYVKAENPT